MNYKDIKLKTFIKWSGNKSKHLRHILPYIPENFNTYYEPFIGSGALFLRLQPEKWVINDLNKDLINCWKNIRNEPDMIIHLFKQFEKDFIKLSKKEKTDYCRSITSKIDSLPYNIVRASIYMLMKYCVYMGHIFSNNKFYFKSLDLQITINNRCFFLETNSYNNLKNISEYLNSTSGLILNKDYKEILIKSKKGDFVFLDPPYIENKNYEFNYNKDEKINHNFILDLYKEVKKLDNKGVKWLMTQADTKDVKNIFKEFDIKKFKVYRRTEKIYKNELIIKNY